MRALFAVLTLAAAATAPAKMPPGEPTELEAFIARPSVAVIASSEVGRLESADATATFTVLVAEDAATARPVVRMRGLRVDLSNNSTFDSVYIDVTQLERLRGEVWVMGDFVDDVRDDEGAPYRYHGSGLCWRANPPLRILCPTFGVTPAGEGMQLGAYFGPAFAFPNRLPADVLKLLDAALAELGSSNRPTGLAPR